MSKSLRSMKESEKFRAITRRLAQPQNKRGLGYWAAKDARKKGTK